VHVNLLYFAEQLLDKGSIARCKISQHLLIKINSKAL
jgi:hypothetical protein